jgi:DNA-binding response OmpR family regulator
MRDKWDASENASHGLKERSATDGEQSRILLVEDDVDLATSLQSVMQNEGFSVDVAFDGGTGTVRGLSGDYSLIVLDILLPVRNGFQVCADIRRRDAAVPIMMLTAKDGEWDEAESLDTGADDYLTKPVSSIVLVAHMRALLRRSQLFSRRRFTWGGLTLDPLKRLCAGPRGEVHLSGREAEVLARLMLAQGEVVSKADLVRDVWGPDFNGDRNIAEVYIRHLRAKIDPCFQHPVITTVHGLGYQLALRDQR